MDELDPLEPPHEGPGDPDDVPWDDGVRGHAAPADGHPDLATGDQAPEGAGLEAVEAGAQAGAALDAAGVLPAPEWLSALEVLDIAATERVGGLEARTWAVAAQEAGADAYVELAGLDEVGQALRAGEAVAVSWAGQLLPLVSVDGDEVVLGEGALRQVWAREEFEPAWEGAGGELVRLAGDRESGRLGALAIIPLSSQLAGSGDAQAEGTHR